MFARVAINIPSNRTFLYSVPEGLAKDVLIGKRVLVPFGKRRITGYILELADSTDRDETKDIIEILDHEPLFSKDDLTFYRWMSDYYMHHLGKSLKSILPGGIDVESNLWLFLSQEEKEQDEKKLSRIQQKIIHTLRSYPAGLSIKKLKKEIRKNQLHEDIKALQELKLITVEDRLKKPNVTTKTEKIINLTNKSASDSRLTEKQKKIIDFLSRQGETPLPTLSREFKNVSSTIGSLGKKGLVCSFSREVYRNPRKDLQIGKKTKKKPLRMNKKPLFMKLPGV